MKINESNFMEIIPPFSCYHSNIMNDLRKLKKLNNECPESILSKKIIILENICYYYFQLNVSTNSRNHDKFCRKNNLLLFSPYKFEQIYSINNLFNFQTSLFVAQMRETILNFRKDIF